MRKLLIVGDSLSMSRYEDGVGYEQMYSSHLALAFPERLVVNASERSNSSKRIASNSYLVEYVFPMMPGVVIIQIGVVDCLPRLLTDFQRIAVSLASKNSITKKLADKYIANLSKRRFQITKKKPLSLIPREKFEENIKSIKSMLILRNPEIKFIVVDIPCPGKNLVEKSYDSNSFVQNYNHILRNVFACQNSRFIDLYETTKLNSSMILKDGYHINSAAHEYIFQSARDILREWKF